MAIFGNKTKDGKIVANFSAASVPGIDPGWAVEAILGDREITIRPRITKEPEVILGYNRIISYAVGDESKIEEHRKSVFGRALAGGLLFGPAGAVVGGIDGTTKKQKRIKRKLLSIEYGEILKPDAVVLEVVGATMGLSKFLGELDGYAPWATPNNSKESPKRITL